MNLIQHSLVDYKNKSYKSWTILFHSYKNVRIIPPDVYDELMMARKKRTEIMGFCQRVFLRVRKALFGGEEPHTYGGDFSDLKKKRSKLYRFL
jgi:hypothetical protein